MSDLSTVTRQRLLALDAAMRAEADAFLEESGLGAIIREEGFEIVGSYAMRTMTWRDLDFERYDDSPDWMKHWELGLRFARNDWVWGLDCLDEYRDPRKLKGAGHYWGLRATRPGGKDFWKLDLWTAPREEFERSDPKRPLWFSRLDEETRCRILEIKEAVCHTPEYRKDLLSVHIYEAVLENGVRGLDEFREWWRGRDGLS